MIAMDTIICKNCVLDSQIPGITINTEKYLIHPYAYYLATLVRQGNMKRDDALKKLNVNISDTSVEEVQRKLNL